MGDMLRKDVMVESDRLTRSINQLTQDREHLTSSYRDEALPRVVGEKLKWACPKCAQQASGVREFVVSGDRLHKCKSCRTYYIIGSRNDERRDGDRRKKASGGRRDE